MIVRILGEGQLDLPDDALTGLETLDDAVETSLATDDTAAFPAALDALLDRVRRMGSPLPDARLEPSDLVLPRAGSSLAEVRALLRAGPDEGGLPGDPVGGGLVPG